MASLSLPSEFTISQKFKTDRRSAVRWILSYARHYWLLLISMTAGAVANAALAVVVPVMVGRAFNLMSAPTPDLRVLAWLAVWVLTSQVVRAGLQFIRNISAELIGQRIERDVRHELYTSLLGKSMTYHALQPVGDTMARATNDVRELNLMFAPGLNLVIGAGIFLLMPLFVAPGFHPALVLTPALFLMGYILSLWRYLNELQPITADVRRSFGELNSRLAEAIDGIETVKGMAQENNEVERFSENAGRYRDAFVRQGDVEARFLPLLLLGLAEAGSLLHSLLLYRQGLLDIGQVVAYFGLIQLFNFPTFTSLFAFSQISLGMAGARRILELINRENNLDQNAEGFSARAQGEIEFRNVSFSYGGDVGDPVLKEISFKVPAGKTVAIVGQTGSGKTTLIKLVNRTYDVSAGQVLLDGVDVRQWNLESLRRNISIIEQDIFLFSRSIGENIAFGQPTADPQRIRDAAKAAQAEEFIAAFDEGYDSVIGERGVTLSGGQRQRLALARAFLTDPPILVLDDSTSAIDSATEDRIQRAIYTAASGRTTLIITHRLSQIRWADLILVLRQGELVAKGTHAELMQTSEAYRRIFRE